MRSRITGIGTLVALSFILAASGFAQGRGPKGSIVIPPSSLERPGDRGKRAHTNIRMFVPAGGFKSPRPAAGGPPYSGYFFETPASVACVYKLVTGISGCNPTTVTANPTGGSKAIAIVDAFDDPNAASDLVYFSHQFGLPAAPFQVVYANGTQPPSVLGWELEESLDIEWSHAMAPKANIYLVEAASDSFSDLFSAVQVASNLVAAAGGGEVSMSWDTGDFYGESYFDSYFTTPGVVYFAAASDSPGPAYPSTSPNVVAAGGTTLRRNPVTGNFLGEAAWEYAGGGLTFNEVTPSYQAGIAPLLSGGRGVPDLSAVADPNTGVWVYDSGNGGWWILGGTSVSSPVLAGIVNLAGHFARSTNAELSTIYNHMAVTMDFKDTVQGYCGYYMQDSAVKGWDFCTGVGSPKGLLGK
jgi:kumamolisin